MSSDSSNDKRIRFMKRMHKSLPMDSIRRIFSVVRSGVITDDVDHDRGIFLSQMDHDPTVANQVKEIDSAWVDSLKYQDQTNSKEYKQFKASCVDTSSRSSELYEMLLEKELKIVIKTVEKLKLFMIKYKDDPELVEKIKDKLNLIIGGLDWHSVYYGRDGRLGEQGQVTAETWPLRTYTGAHPEYIMNVFIYNPPKGEKRFKVLRIDGNKVTYQRYRNNEPVGEPIKLGLDEFLKIGLSVEFLYFGISYFEYVPIGEVYKIFPKRHVNEKVESHNAKVNKYLKNLMIIFANKPSSEIFSTPVKSASGGTYSVDRRRKTHHNRDNNKNKRTYKRRK
jgi:hypothetical protein